jgi:hypothetical protein
LAGAASRRRAADAGPPPPWPPCANQHLRTSVAGCTPQAWAAAHRYQIQNISEAAHAQRHRTQLSLSR